MCLYAVDIRRLSLAVQRLMDADLLLPVEGSTLLAQLEAFGTMPNPTHAEHAFEGHEAFLRTLEALTQTHSFNDPIGRRRQELIGSLLHLAPHPNQRTEENIMSLQLGDTAPDFTQESTAGPISFHQWAGDSWVILFSHPKDFTPVCTTELGAAAKLKPEFDKRNVKIIGLSVDGVSDHAGWSKDIEETQGVALNFPLLADADRKVSHLYGMIHPNADNTMTVRSVFIIGPDKKLKLTLTYPASTGRNFNEILRVVDSLQLTAHYKVATPVNWQAGEDCIIVPTVSNEEADRLFRKGYKVIKPYLRTTPQPNL